MHDGLHYFLGGGIIFSLMNDLIRMGGLTADLKFGYTQSNDFNINITPSKEVLGEIHPLFNHKVTEVSNPIIIGIDGRIDSISEVDHILQELAGSGKSAIIMALGFSPDLATTLSENWGRGKLNVVPYNVKQWDINGKYDAIEICKSLNIGCISSELGDAFSSFTLDFFEDHETVYITPRGIMIKSKDGESLCAEIKIPKRMKEISGVIRDRCKISQKMCIGIARSGACSKDFTSSIYEKYSVNIKSSYSSELIGTKAAKSCQNLISNMGNLIISE